LCASLSNIPFKKKTVPLSDYTCSLRELQNVRESVGFDSLPSNQVAAWTIAASPPDFLSENFFAQISSPSCMISRREGSILEHAMALCSLLLGKGENAYVAIGNVKKRCYVWVIVFKSRQEMNGLMRKNRMADTEEEEIEVLQNGTYIYGSLDSSESFNVQDFERFSKTETIKVRFRKQIPI
jgi:hypothetical protein